MLKEKANTKSKLDRYFRLLQYLGLILILGGFGGPWYYGPLGKSADFGWQPVWGFLSGLLYINVFLLLSVISCESYTEWVMQRGRPVLEGILQWIGGFLVLVIIVPLAVWLTFDQTTRSHSPQQSVDSLGWGVWITLIGLIIQVGAFRLRIWFLRKFPINNVLKLPYSS